MYNFTATISIYFSTFLKFIPGVGRSWRATVELDGGWESLSYMEGIKAQLYDSCVAVCTENYDLCLNI